MSRKYSKLTYYHVSRASYPRDIYPARILIPKSKNQKLDEYVKNNDTITQEVMESFGISKFPQVLRGAERRCKCEIVQINNTTWNITK